MLCVFYVLPGSGPIIGHRDAQAQVPATRRGATSAKGAGEGRGARYTMEGHGVADQGMNGWRPKRWLGIMRHAMVGALMAAMRSHMPRLNPRQTAVQDADDADAHTTSQTHDSTSAHAYPPSLNGRTSHLGMHNPPAWSDELALRRLGVHATTMSCTHGQKQCFECFVRQGCHTGLTLTNVSQSSGHHEGSKVWFPLALHEDSH